jgi:hypothetical protein
MTEVETAVAIMVEMNRSAGAVLAILLSADQHGRKPGTVNRGAATTDAH